MRLLKTKNCIVCGKDAKLWHGHVIAKERMALGNHIDKKIIAGFCEQHEKIRFDDDSGCYGNYNRDLMGECIPLF